jgi:hypothetical protein
MNPNDKQQAKAIATLLLTAVALLRKPSSQVYDPEFVAKDAVYTAQLAVTELDCAGVFDQLMEARP